MPARRRVVKPEVVEAPVVPPVQQQSTRPDPSPATHTTVNMQFVFRTPHDKGPLDSIHSELRETYASLLFALKSQALDVRGSFSIDPQPE